MKPHVLLVDDSALVTGALRLLLEETGYRVSEAASVAEAIAVASAEQPDAMLLDITLPDGDGLSVLSALHSRGEAPRVTVALTGHDEDAVRQRCLEAGCRDLLVKPIAPMALPRQIAEWLAESERPAGRTESPG